MRKAKGCRQTKSRSTPVPSSPCLRHAFHSTVQKQKSRTCLPCKVAFLSLGLARSKEKKKKKEKMKKEYLRKVITRALKLEGAIQGQCTAAELISFSICYQRDSY